MPYWEYLAAHPDQQALFDQAMVQRARALSLACVPVLDWPATGTIADIAGGTGTLLAAVLQAAPGARGVLVDQPQVLERAQPVLEALARGATRDTRLRIFEMLLPTDATPHRARMSDVLMLLLFDGARERTLEQYRARWRAPAGGWSGSCPARGR